MRWVLIEIVELGTLFPYFSENLLLNVDSSWILTMKIGLDGKVHKLKLSLVTMGYTDFWLGNNDTFSLITKMHG